MRVRWIWLSVAFLSLFVLGCGSSDVSLVSPPPDMACSSESCGPNMACAATTDGKAECACQLGFRPRTNGQPGCRPSLCGANGVTGEWQDQAPMKTGRQFTCAVYVPEVQKVVVVGGAGRTDIQAQTLDLLDSVEIFDLATQTWSDGAPIPQVIYAHSCVARQGKVWVLGGWSTVTDTRTFTSNKVWIYDPVQNTWTPGPPLKRARAWASAVVRQSLGGDEIVLVGGRSNPAIQNGMVVQKYESSIEVSNGGAWRLLNPASLRSLEGFGLLSQPEGLYLLGGGYWPEQGPYVYQDNITLLDSDFAQAKDVGFLPRAWAGIYGTSTSDGMGWIVFDEEVWQFTQSATPEDWIKQVAPLPKDPDEVRCKPFQFTGPGFVALPEGLFLLGGGCPRYKVVGASAVSFYCTSP